MNEEEFTVNSLLKSEKVIGQLRSVLVNQDGKVLDGNHRVAANKEWHTKVIETKSRVEEILVRMHAHHRRQVPMEETKALFEDLAEELFKSGVEKQKVASELVKVAPYSEGYILRLLPNEFKQQDKSRAGKISANLSEQKKEEAQRVTCEGDCGIGVYYPKQWHGHNLCTRCLKKAQLKPELWLGKLRKSEAPPSNNRVKVEKPAKKWKESWEFRKARMQPKTSKLDKKVYELLQNDGDLKKAGWKIEKDQVFCVESTEPDVFLTKENRRIAVYHDHVETHKDEEKDDLLRAKLRDRHGVETMSRKYENPNEAEEIFQWIKEAALQ